MNEVRDDQEEMMKSRQTANMATVLAAVFICLLLAGAALFIKGHAKTPEAEVGSLQYAQTQEYVRRYPALVPMIRQALSDKRLTTSEWERIHAASEVEYDAKIKADTIDAAFASKQAN